MNAPTTIRSLLSVGLPLILLVAGYMVVRGLAGPDHEGAPDGSPVEVIALAAADGCDLAGAGCSLHAADGLEVRLLAEGTIAPLRRFGLALETEVAVDEARLLLEMKGMEMNVRPVVFVAAGSGRMEGTTILPACPAGRDDWEGYLLLQVAGRWYGGDIPFTAR